MVTATATLPEQANNQVQMPDEPIYEIATLGEGLVLKKRQTVELTQDFANEFLEFPEFIGDRALMEPHVIFLARQMEAGTFRWEWVSLATCVCDGREYRMNGQHTCWARIYADLKRGVRSPVQWLKYEAKTEQDMRQLYATIDRGKARGMGNVVVSYLSGRSEFPDYTKPQLRRLAEGLALWRWEDSATRQLHTGDERAYLLLTEYNTLALKIGNFIRETDAKDAKHIYRMPCIAAQFATFNKASNIALEFWRTVRDGVGIADKHDARHTLRNYLMTTVLAAPKGNPDLKTSSQEDMYRACLLAWNAYRSGKQLKHLRPSATEGRPEAR